MGLSAPLAKMRGTEQEGAELRRLRFPAVIVAALVASATVGGRLVADRGAAGQDAGKASPDAAARESMKMWKVVTTGVDTNLRGISVVHPPAHVGNEIVCRAARNWTFGGFGRSARRRPT